MVDQARARRLAKRITQIVAEALEHEVKDPRLAMVTITDTRVTGDLREATVYYTVLGETIDAAPDSAGAAAALASATGVLRTMVGAGTGIRHTPSLQFVPDAVPDEARRMEELLARTRESDAEVARLAAGARPAGEPDPYRSPREPDGTRMPTRSEPGSDRRGRHAAGRRRYGDTAGPRAARRRLAGQRAGAGHRPAPAGGGGAGLVRHPEQMPETLRMLDVYGLVVPPEQVPPAPEVLVACDAAEPARLGTLADRLATARHSIMIDHHATNPGFGQLQLLDPGAEATVVVVRRLLAAMDVPLDADVARCIYAGLVTDTSNFITAGESAHRLAAELVAAGVDAEPLVRTLMYTHPHAWLAALGRTLERAVLEPDAAGGLGLVHTTVPCSDVDRFRTEDVDSVVDMVRTTAEAEVAAVSSRSAETRWITSLRSDGRIDVAAVAGRLGGGGHPGAAGFTWEGTEGELLDALRAALRRRGNRRGTGAERRAARSRDLTPPRGPR